MKDGDLKTKWMRWQPYLNEAYRAGYAAWRILFLERKEQRRTRQLPRGHSGK
jgi:hypothetical protein